jgi:hypothetical protein
MWCCRRPDQGQKDVGKSGAVSRRSRHRQDCACFGSITRAGYKSTFLSDCWQRGLFVRGQEDRGADGELQTSNWCVALVSVSAQVPADFDQVFAFEKPRKSTRAKLPSCSLKRQRIPLVVLVGQSHIWLLPSNLRKAQRNYDSIPVYMRRSSESESLWATSSISKQTQVHARE